MIHKLNKHTLGIKAISADLANEPSKVAPYENVIVRKPWGYEYLVFENDFVGIWMLHLVRKRMTSMHCHPRKTTSLVMLSGNAKLSNEKNKIELNSMDAVFIDKGIYHSTESYSNLPLIPQSENGNWILEIESPPIKGDLVRKNDEYGRSGKAYEDASNMVYDFDNCLNFKENEISRNISKRFFECEFKIINEFKLENLPTESSLVVIIAIKKNKKDLEGNFKVGEIFHFRDLSQKFDLKKLNDNYTFLVIEKEKRMMRIADYIFQCIADLGIKDVFAVSGGGAMHLVDAVGKNDKLNYVATHHEQAAAMAAEANARITGKPGALLVTSGPGGTNAITGVCGAWIDSIPMICISGQVTTDMLLKDTGLRQLGIQESDITTLVSSITKYAVTVKDPLKIKYYIQKAIHLATNLRPGPVWLDIPLDIQSKLINPDELEPYTDSKPNTKIKILQDNVSKTIDMLKKADRPVILCGYGVHLSKAEEEFSILVDSLGIPVISSWTSSDIIPTDHDFYIGRSGIMGDRAGNFTVQNADLIIIIGSRMSIPQVGYNPSFFAREAKKIVVDIDPAEFSNKAVIPDLPIEADAKEFIVELLDQLKKTGLKINKNLWIETCNKWKKKYPVALPEYSKNKNLINSFYFIDLLSKKLDSNAVVVTDMGTSFTCTMQTFNVKKGQRLFTSSGDASMGFGLPGAIGACFGNNKKKTICISGDGGLQMNIQELQTIVHNKLPIILFVINNNGYLTIKLMQQNHFGTYVGSEPSSGVSCPDILKIASAYGIPSIRLSNQEILNEKIDWILDQTGPYICEIMMSENQPLIPRVSSFKKPDGTIIAKPLEDLYPFLEREEFMSNMFIEPIEPLK